MDNKNFWNWCTFSYDFWHYLELSSYKKIAKEIYTKISGNEKILEIACGTGILTHEIIKKCPYLKYTAIDNADKMIEICHKKGINANFQIMDATKLNFPDNEFDIIIIANALHIIPNPNIVISEMQRCLKENGIIYAPNFLTPSTFYEKFILNIIRKFGYKVYNEFTRETYLKMLEDNRLEIASAEIFKCFRTLMFVETEKKRTLKK